MSRLGGRQIEQRTRRVRKSQTIDGTGGKREERKERRDQKMRNKEQVALRATWEMFYDKIGRSEDRRAQGGEK